MDVTGRMEVWNCKTTVVLNIVGICLAAIVTAEGVYIAKNILGYVDTSDYFGMFVPIIIMFMIGNKSFSCVFMSIYVLLSLMLAREVWLIMAGTPLSYHGKD